MKKVKVVLVGILAIALWVTCFLIGYGCVQPDAVAGFRSERSVGDVTLGGGSESLTSILLAASTIVALLVPSPVGPLRRGWRAAWRWPRARLGSRRKKVM